MAIDADVERRMRALREGRIDTVGTATMRDGFSTTVVLHPACSSGSLVVTQPLSNPFAADFVVSVTPSNGSFTVNHAVNLGTTSIIRYAIFTDAMTH